MPKSVLLIGGSGYVGSSLTATLQAAGNHVEVVDLCGTSATTCHQVDFRRLSRADLMPFDVIILLAGSSSVKQAEARPVLALETNIAGFTELTRKLCGQRFIYASSASVYPPGIREAQETCTTCESQSIYDISKFTIDRLAQLSGVEYYGLRFATVCGYSPVLRIDLLINRMVYTAIKDGAIRVQNAEACRSVLGLRDLGRAMLSIIEKEVPVPGLYNLASFNTTILGAAEAVAKLLDVPVLDEGKTPTFDFTIDTRKFREEFSWNPTDTVQSIVHDLREGWHSCVTIERT